MPGHVFFPNCPFAWGSGPHLIHASLAHPSPQSKRHLDRFSRFCKVHVRVSSSMSEHVLPLKIASSHGDLYLHLMRVSLGPSDSAVRIPNGISIGSAVFAQTTAECPYTLQWAALPPQNCPFPWGCVPPSNTWLLWPTPVLNPNDISIG